ncbi:MAG: response regulator transcription factor [Spirochaetales bacterium]|nr:response regulator transcription factor [Spirochaetales bacterium]
MNMPANENYTLILLFTLGLALAIAHVGMFQRRKQEREKNRECLLHLEEENRRLEGIVETLGRPRYNRDIDFLRSEKIMMESIRQTRSVNSKILASHMCLAESTIRNRIFQLCRKLNFHSRSELMTYVMLSIPED